MATISVVGWRLDDVQWRAEGVHAAAEFSRRLRRGISASPAQRRKIEISVLAREHVEIHDISVDHVQSMMHVLEALGAEILVDMGTGGQWHRQRP